MKLNIDNCDQIFFSRKRQSVSLSYSIDGDSINKVEQVKYLGVQFARNMSWNAYIDFMTALANHMLNFLRQNVREGPQNVKTTLFCFNVRAILEYVSVFGTRKGAN